jgi:hypothetical protein
MRFHDDLVITLVVLSYEPCSDLEIDTNQLSGVIPATLAGLPLVYVIAVTVLRHQVSSTRNCLTNPCSLFGFLCVQVLFLLRQ